VLGQSAVRVTAPLPRQAVPGRPGFRAPGGGTRARARRALPGGHHLRRRSALPRRGRDAGPARSRPGGHVLPLRGIARVTALVLVGAPPARRGPRAPARLPAAGDVARDGRPTTP